MKYLISLIFVTFIFASSLVSLYNKATYVIVPVKYNSATEIVDTMWQQKDAWKKKERGDFPERIKSYISIWEQIIVDQPAFHEFYLESFGFLQRLMGRNIMEDANPEASVVRLTTGQLSFLDTPTNYGRKVEPEDFDYEIHQIKRLSVLADSASSAQIYYIVHPYKRGCGMPYHLVHNPNKEHDDSIFINALLRCGIKVLDLNKYLPSTPSIAYYNTDHHWRIEYAFSQLPVICEFLDVPNTLFSNPQNFRLVNTGKEMIGSMTKRTGRLFTTLRDTIKYYMPLFETRLEAKYYSSDRIIKRNGDFMHTVMFPEFLELDPVPTNYYALCNHGDNPMVQITNFSPYVNENLLIIADSFGAPIISYFSLLFKHIDCLDLRSNVDNGVYEMIRNNHYNKIVFIYLQRSEKHFSFN